MAQHCQAENGTHGFRRQNWNLLRDKDSPKQPKPVIVKLLVFKASGGHACHQCANTEAVHHSGATGTKNKGHSKGASPRCPQTPWNHFNATLCCCIFAFGAQHCSSFWRAVPRSLESLLLHSPSQQARTVLRGLLCLKMTPQNQTTTTESPSLGSQPCPCPASPTSFLVPWGVLPY